MLVSSVKFPKSRVKGERQAKPYCMCWDKHAPTPWEKLVNFCSCGEEADSNEWQWEVPEASNPSWVVISEDKKQVIFHPFYSSGTATIKGDTPLKHNHHYYWEVKMLTETYGTDIMIGIGTSKVNIESQFKFRSLLGEDGESYGLSYTGSIKHDAIAVRDCHGFCRGTIIGVRVDLWRGTLEFYLNRKPQGISFFNLRRHETLFPMLCSTAAQSSMRLIYAASWQASLLVDAAKILAASVSDDTKLSLPPGLWHSLKSQFWLTLPTKGCILEDEEQAQSDMELETVQLAANMLSEVTPGPYMNGFYIDGVERDHRLVLWME